jgi:hypothetical protein
VLLLRLGRYDRNRTLHIVVVAENVSNILAFIIPRKYLVVLTRTIVHSDPVHVLWCVRVLRSCHDRACQLTTRWSILVR